MKTDIFTLCDSAQEYGGKLVIVGAYNNINANKFPFNQSLSLVARIIFDEAEKQGEHNMEFYVKKKDEDVYLLKDGKLNINIANFGEHNSAVNLIIKTANVLIPSAGSYIVYLKVDDQVFQSDLNISQK